MTGETVFPPLAGHRDARDAVARALERNLLSQSLLITGQPGVGKERFGLWLGQLILCRSRTGSPPRPCGRCRSCLDVARLQHPDLHWFFPLARPKVSSPDKLGGALEDMRAVELEARRANALHQTEHERAPAYFVALVRTIQQMASRRPSSGGQAVFVLGDVEKMVPQEGVEAAANAFLKVLEEPPPGIVFILTTSAPGALLPTIRSRVLPVRLGPLSSHDIEEFLTAHGVEATSAARAAAEAGGSLGRAIRLSADPDTAADDFDLASLAADPSIVFRQALGVSPWGARSEEFTDRLDAVLRSVHRNSSASEKHARTLWEAAERAEASRAHAQGNVNPQLILADFLLRLHTALRTSE